MRPFQQIGADIVLLVFRRFARGRSAKALNVGFHPLRIGKVDGVIRILGPSQFAEEIIAAKRTDESAFKFSELRKERSGAVAQYHVGRTVLIIALIRNEEEQFVLYDRSAQRSTILLAFESRLGAVSVDVEYTLLRKALVGIRAKHFAVEFVGPRFGDCGYDCRRSLLILGLIVLGKHPKFLNR